MRSELSESAENKFSLKTISAGKGRIKMNGSIHIGLAAFGAAIAVGIIGMRAAEAVGRNPEASTKVLVQSILAIAFAEAIVFYTLFLVK
jgi:F-type H+-transporting ATPase subunit c